MSYPIYGGGGGDMIDPVARSEIDNLQTNVQDLRVELDAEVAKPSAANDDPGDLAQLFNNA